MGDSQEFIPRTTALAKNIEQIGYHDLNGKPGFQMAMQEVDGRYYIYSATFAHPGWHILDVTDPAKPDYVKWIDGPPLKGQGTPKIQVAGGLMITALGGTLPFLHGTEWGDPFEQGVIIWDVKDPVNPKKLSEWHCGGMGGVHRFYYDGGRYCHLSATYDGFRGFIYVILDLADPTNPVEAGAVVGSRPVAGRPGAAARGPRRSRSSTCSTSAVMHGPAYPKDGIAYVSYGGGGMMVLDIANSKVPQLIGQLKHHPPLAGKMSGARCHTVLPLSDRPYAVFTTEGERYHYFNEKIIADSGCQPLNILGMVDISDPKDPQLISVFPYPEIPAEWPYENFNDIPGRGPRTVRAAQHPRAAQPSGPGGPHRPAVLLLLPRRPAHLRHQRSLHPQRDRLFHPAGPAQVAVQQQDRRPVPRPAHRHGRGHPGGQPWQHLHRHVQRRHLRAALHGIERSRV